MPAEIPAGQVPTLLPLAAPPSPAPAAEPESTALFAPPPVPCYEQDKPSLCKKVHEWTGNEWVAQSSDWLIARPLKIVAIIAAAVLVRWLVHRAIKRIAARASRGGALNRFRNHHPAQDQAGTLATERRRQRIATMASVFASTSTIVIGVIAGLTALGELDVNIGPFIAGAGILGVALGFGAQSLVKDFLSGIFMILEDQYGVGDDIDVGTATGIVEAVGLRVTRIRDINGTVWYVRNGEVLAVGNRSHGWARTVLDVDIAYAEDIPRVKKLLNEVGEAIVADSEYKELILEPPTVWGVEALGADAVVMRMVVKTMPGMQYKVARALRERVKEALDAHGVEIPFPQRTIWVRNDAKNPAPDLASH
jgi:small-conductance mechanosensitive channel